MSIITINLMYYNEKLRFSPQPFKKFTEISGQRRIKFHIFAGRRMCDPEYFSVESLALEPVRTSGRPVYGVAEDRMADRCHVYADLDARIRRIARIYDLTDAKAKDMILKTDKKRASYYNYYTNKKWSDAKSYELCLTSSELGIDGTAKAIIDYVQLKESIAADKRHV